MKQFDVVFRFTVDVPDGDVEKFKKDKDEFTLPIGTPIGTGEIVRKFSVKMKQKRTKNEPTQ